MSERVEFLPEKAYFSDTDVSWSNEAMRITEQCVFRWADRYEAWPLSRPDDRSFRRQGAVPRRPREREEVFRELQAWAWEGVPPGTETFPSRGLGLTLWRGDEILLHTGWGLPSPLRLTAQEFVALRRCLVQHGLPRDLYFRSGKERRVIEPVRRFGGVFRTAVIYTPVQWRQRDPAAIRPLAGEIPDEEARRARFRQACTEFRDAVSLRMSELSEPGQEGNERSLAALSTLVTCMVLACHLAGHGDNPQLAAQLSRAMRRQLERVSASSEV